MTQHTPGPWKVGPAKHGYGFWISHTTMYRDAWVATVNLVGGNEEALANARLIATAPELLEASKAALLAFESFGQHYENPEEPSCPAVYGGKCNCGFEQFEKAMEQIKIAVAKAEGRA